jgi:hypothetical protein
MLNRAPTSCYRVGTNDRIRGSNGWIGYDGGGSGGRGAQPFCATSRLTPTQDPAAAGLRDSSLKLWRTRIRQPA